MIKRFPSRNQRSKGIKVKHVLQIILLLGVSFWLIYQVKHNHDKKKEFDKNDANLSVRTQADQILKLGRKDLHPGKDEVNQNEKHEEEDEDEHIEEDEENKHEHDELEEAKKHETEEQEDNEHGGIEQGEEKNKNGEEQEEDENRSEEMEDEGRGGEGNAENDIDENDQEKSEVDTDRDDQFMDEEKEKEEGDEKENRFVDEEKEKDDEGGEKENRNSEEEEKGGLVENDNNHEAREEHYKGDDASSAVTHDTHATSAETETFSVENSDVNLEMNINQTTDSDKSIKNQIESDLKVTEREALERISSNATADKDTGNNNSTNLGDSLYLNETAVTNPDSHLDSSSNLTDVITEATNNLTGAGANSSEQNETVISSESNLAQNTISNTTIDGDVKNVQAEGLEQSGNTISEENLPDTNATVSVKTKNGDTTTNESSNLGNVELEKTTGFVASNETENTSQNSDRNENESTDTSNTEKSETNGSQNIDATEDDMFNGDTQTGENEETSDASSANETLDSVEHDAIDSSDTHIHEDAAEVRTDLDTLPDFRNEGDNGDETATE